MRRHVYPWLLASLFLCTTAAFAQVPENREAGVKLHFTNGLNFTTRDSTASINLRFRIQNRADFETQAGDDLGLASHGGYIKRLRLRSSGYLLSKKLTYSLQLGFSPGDMDVENSDHPQLIRDAVLFYQFTPNLKIGFGQTKLPGNRQRVISSGEQQFVDRSIVNATFTIDRDFGLFAFYENEIGTVPIRLQAALSNGDGRNASPVKGSGAAYTGRVEVLPFGEFTLDGDYFEGDWVREPKPKLALGFGLSENDNAYRAGGQIGSELPGFTDLEAYMGDLIFKYNGWATQHEWIQRKADQTQFLTGDGTDSFIYAGQGYNGQVSYQWPNHFELAARYAVITPEKQIQHLARQTRHYTVGANYYIRWHRIKLQSDLTYQTRENLAVDNSQQDNWILRFQMELGI
ncbi:MAG: porin [Rufibacter sp.]